MLSCTACKRFLREDAQGCPFCGVPRVTTFAPVAIVVALGVALAACGPSVGGGDGGSSTGTADTGTSTNATVDEGPGSSPSTTANPTVGTSMNDSSTGTLDTTSGEDDVTDDEGAAFYGGAPDGGGTPLECDVWAQDCPKGEKCLPWANDGGTTWNATRCSPLDAMPGAPGDPCQVEGSATSGIDDCELGAMCWNVDPETNQGTCVAQCGGSEANPLCEDPATSCMIAYDGVVQVCLPACDPVAQDCGDPGLSCVPVDDVFVCVPDQSGKSGQTGTGCTSFDGCDPGLYCAAPELVPNCVDVGCCTEFCDLTADDPDSQCTAAAEGAQCLEFYDDNPPPNLQFIGVCVLPS